MNVIDEMLHPELEKFYLLSNNLHIISANVRKWEAAFKNDEKELEKVKNDEARHMKVRIFFLFTKKIQDCKII